MSGLFVPNFIGASPISVGDDEPGVLFVDYVVRLLGVGRVGGVSGDGGLCGAVAVPGVDLFVDAVG